MPQARPASRPISAVMGVPMELLMLLIAIEVIPDIFRTAGNVTADLAVPGPRGARSERWWTNRPPERGWTAVRR
jgi:L-cystine uptake protein TcyP (sodium:dicarboxylate symporter family)